MFSTVLYKILLAFSHSTPQCLHIYGKQGPNKSCWPKSKTRTRNLLWLFCPGMVVYAWRGKWLVFLCSFFFVRLVKMSCNVFKLVANYSLSSSFKNNIKPSRKRAKCKEVYSTSCWIWTRVFHFMRNKLKNIKA